MDDGFQRVPRQSQPKRPAQGSSRSARRDSAPRPERREPSPSTGQPPKGLLGRYGKAAEGHEAQQNGHGRDEGREPRRALLHNGGPPTRGWGALTGRVRKMGQNFRSGARADRTPRAGEWRASDFESHELEAWDHEDAVPFELPPDPDAEFRVEAPRPRYSDGRNAHSNAYSRDANRRNAPYWDDEDDANVGWETGTWDNGWATNAQGNLDYGRLSGEESDAVWSPSGDQTYAQGEDDAVSRSLGTLAKLGAVGPSLGRIAKLRLLLRRRPAAAALLAFFLLGFMLTACAPLIPLLRLGYDAADAAQRASKLQALLAGGSAALLNSNNLKEAQSNIDGIQRDLYEINGAMSVIGAPLGAVSPQIRNYQLLVHMGYELVTAADEGIQVAQTVLTPLQGGALAADNTPGLTTADMQQAKNLVSDAEAHIQNAVAYQSQLDPSALPSQLQPGSKYGKLLAELPQTTKIFGEIQTLLDVAPSLLGIGQPANYLVLVMDRSELRPGGGFTGNFGILELDGGKQSTKHPLALQDVYKLDQQYYQKFTTTDPSPNPCPGLTDVGPQPPNYYWWFPIRCDPAGKYGWGLRDANLSPNFSLNAQTAMQIVEDAGGWVPNSAPIQGVVAFTPVLIEDLIAATGGSLYVPQFKTTVTPANLEHTIHEYQLRAPVPPGVDRKQFTHDLSSVLLDKIKHLPHSQLKEVFNVAVQALKSKDLQVYFRDPRAELILQQLGLASDVSTSIPDGYYVVDANDGGNKANQFVTEHQTDLVTLMPNGGAIHQLQIAVTYDKKGDIFNPGVDFDDYSDVQRTYMPGDATILGYSGYPADYFTPGGCHDQLATPVSDCSAGHAIFGPSTLSDVPGRTMLLGALLVTCGQDASIRNYDSYVDYNQCESNPQPHTAYVYISWYTPHAFSIGPNGHGTYTEVVGKQPGTTLFLPNGKLSSQDTLTVYVNTTYLHGGSVSQEPSDWVIPSSFEQGNTSLFESLTSQAQKAFDGPIVDTTNVSFNF